MTTGWTIDGTDIRTYAYDIESADGWDSFPRSKFSTLDHPFRTGEAISQPRFYGPKDLTLSMLVFPQDTTGKVTTSPLEHLQDNVDTLLGLFHSSSPLSIVRTLPDTVTTRTIEAEVLDAFSMRTNRTNIRRFVARLRLPYPIWKEGSVKNVTGTGAQVLTNNGNAPIHNALITFTTSGRLTVDASGDYIEASQANVIVDLENWTITQSGSPADNLLDHNRAWLVIFEPGANNLTATGTIDIDFYDAYF